MYWRYSREIVIVSRQCIQEETVRYFISILMGFNGALFHCTIKINFPNISAQQQQLINITNDTEDSHIKFVNIR